MHSRWRILGSIVLLALSACQAPDLARRFVVNDAVWVQPAGFTMPLGPGDVLILTTWQNGFAATDNPPQNPNSLPPRFTTERLALRHVSGPLKPLEAAVLGAVLATHVDALPRGAGLANALQKEQAALWNALTAALVLSQRTAASQPLQLQVDYEKFCEAYSTSGSDAHRSLILQSYFGVPAGGACSGSVSDLRNIAQLETALAPLTDPSNMRDGFYQQANRLIAAARVEVEIAGASMRTREGVEARWSLAEWEDARICKDDGGTLLEITDIEIGDRYRRKLRVVSPNVADGERPEIEVVSDAQKGRVIRRDKDGKRGTISRASLQLLFPSDLDSVTWGAGDAKIARSLRPACNVD